jgi:predicted transcriptional regulator
MSPGSLKDWPIEEQRALFAILGDVEGSIGVRLSESLVMIPSKSLSGIYFPTEVPFYSCQLCPRERCPSRRATYDESAARDYGIVK